MSDVIERLNGALEGRYRIERELGQGGMATVYLAEDVRHDRQVALKVLKPELAAVVGAERFLTEIKTTAQLQHPHILPLHDSGEADSFLFYVMPYVEGESLREKLEREQQLPVEDALAIAEKVAGALQYAHDQGVIHRDIKPANILLSRGEPLVADFGIALAVSQAGDGRITETGLSLGTPHYMSPEQAAGERTLDKRSDVYALGCVLYEMLTGQPPFGGPNAQAVLGRILTGEPDPVTDIRRSVPANVEAAVHKSLERLPADRFESASAFVSALEDPGFTTTVGTMTRGGAVAERRWRRRFGVAAAGAAVLAVVAVAGWLRDGTAPPDRMVRFARALSFTPNDAQVAISPDGGRFVYGNDDTGELWLRSLDAVGVRGLEIAGIHPTFSPNGQSVAVVSDGQLQVHPLGGGPARTLADVNAFPRSAWGDDGFLYFTPPEPRVIARIPEGGGPVDTVLVSETDGIGYAPQVVLPGSRGLVYKRFGGPTGTVDLFVLDLDTGDTSFIATTSPTNRSVSYASTGHLLYSTERYLLAHPFDARSLEPTGEPVPVAEVPAGQLWFAYRAGTLVYWATAGGTALVPVIANRRGETRPLPNLGQGGFNYPEVSPQGDRIAFQVTAAEQSDDIWIYEMPAGPLTRLSLEGGASATTWSRDGNEIFFVRTGDAYRTRSDGSRPAEPVLDRERTLARLALSPDGERMYYQEGPGEWDIGVYTLGVEGSDSLVLAGNYWEGHPAISPDGRWIAYYSNESGTRTQLYVRPLYGPGRKHQISVDGGSRPRWSSDGTELFFAGDPGDVSRSLSVARLDVGEEDLDVVEVRRLFDMPSYNYDVFPGDSLFVVLMPESGENATPEEMIVVANFDRVLREVGRP